jgi:hypothetical protein
LAHVYSSRLRSLHPISLKRRARLFCSNFSSRSRLASISSIVSCVKSYGKLNTLDNKTNSIHEARKGWRPQLKAGITAAWEFGMAGLVVGLLAIFWQGSSTRCVVLAFSFIVAFIILQKLNLPFSAVQPI